MLWLSFFKMKSIYIFPKEEKLCGKNNINLLYENGKRFTCFPLRITYTIFSFVDNPCLKILIWAPKSLFRRANQRNHLKRLIREAFRLNAPLIRDYVNANRLQINIAYNYIAKEQLSFTQVNKAVQKSIARIINENAANNT